MALIVRDLKRSDFGDIVEYYYRFYDEVKEKPSLGIALYHKKPSLSEERKWFAELCKSVGAGSDVVTVAEVDSHVVGLCEVRCIGRPQSEVSHRGDLGIMVSREHRGKGVGTALLRETLRKCAGSFEVIELSVFETNEVAVSLYEKFGFRAYGRRPKSVKRGQRYFDEILMRLELDAKVK